LTVDGALYAQDVTTNGGDPIALRVNRSDTDGDGRVDLFDNCLNTANADQLNSDGDGDGNACDADDDNDGMPDTYETANGLNSLVDDAAGDLDGDGVRNLSEYAAGTDPNDSASKPVIVAEQGLVAGVTHDWGGITSSGSYANPVVIVTPPSNDDPEKGVIRLRNVTDNGFDVAFQEWKYLDGIHGSETINYLVMESGREVLPDGTVIEAGTFSVSDLGNFVSKSFSSAFAGKPELFLTVQTYNGADPVTVRARNVTTSGFEAALNEEQASNAHAAEVVGYIAVYSATGTITLPLLGGEATATTDYRTLDHNGSAAHWHSVGNLALSLEEESSFDSELNHIPEGISLLTVDGALYAQDVTTNGGDPIALRLDLSP